MTPPAPNPALRESALLRRIYARSTGLAGSGGIVVGPGDDCAAIRLHGLTLLTVDQLVEHRHFDLDSAPIELIARKAIARSVSDIAAMAGAPVAALATGCLPRSFTGAGELFDRMADSARALACPLIGGDIAVHDGPLLLTVTVVGRAHHARGPVLRGGASPGDEVFVTGALGGSLASGRHLTFTPRVREAGALADRLGASLRAMIDISDGLGRDAARIAEASGVRIELDAAALPRHPGVSDWHAAASDGEDYELLFTAAPGSISEGADTAGGTPLTRIGRVTAGSGCVIRAPDGREIDASELGWEHGA